MRQPICSMGHFERLMKFFHKIARKQILEMDHPKDRLIQLILDHFWEEELPLFEAKLIREFKLHPHKTRSGFMEKIPNKWMQKDITWYVSYTVERNGRRGLSPESFLTYRIFLKIDGGKKRRVIRIKVPTNWIKDAVN